MRNTWNTKRQKNLFLSHITNDNSNEGAVDESKIYGRHYTKIVIYPEKMLCIYYNYWWQNVTDRATVIEWAVNFRQRFCNALSIDATLPCYSSTQFILQVLHLQGRPYSQQHLFAITRSSIVDFLHQQDPFKKNPPMKNIHFPTKFGHERGYSSMSFLVRKMKICQRCRIIFYL